MTEYRYHRTPASTDVRDIQDGTRLTSVAPLGDEFYDRDQTGPMYVATPEGHDGAVHLFADEIVPNPTIMTPDEATILRAHAEATAEPEIIRAVATYQMMGDWEGMRWANHILGAAKREGDLVDFKALTSVPGVFGIELVVFQVDLECGKNGVPKDMTNGQAEFEEAITSLLNEIVGDSDVEVLWVGSTTNPKLTDSDHDAGPEPEWDPMVTVYASNDPAQRGSIYRLVTDDGEERLLGDADDRYHELASIVDTLFDAEVTCDRHGGPWGDDETCEKCTDDNGNPRSLG